MTNFRSVTFFGSILFGLTTTLASQVVTSTAVITSTLTSSGYICFSQSTYSESTPAGALPSSVNMTGFTWGHSANSLTMNASGLATACGFSQPTSMFQRAGTVQLTLTSPYLVSYTISVSGTVSISGASSTTVVSGALSGTLGGFFNPTTSINQSAVVVVGPGGTTVTINHSSGGPSLLSGSASASLIVNWAPEDAASATSFGIGCLTGAPTLTSPSLPLLGSNLTADVSGVAGPVPVGLIAVGFSNVTSTAGPLPVSLTSAGMTDCNLLQSANITFVATPTSATTLSWSTGLPATGAFVGVTLFGQAFCLAPGVNPLQVVASNGMAWQLGT